MRNIKPNDFSIVEFTNDSALTLLSVVCCLAQAPSQMELENWMNGLHSACASSFARQHGKENTLKLLRSEIQKLENSIDLVSRPPAPPAHNVCILVMFSPRMQTNVNTY